MCVVERTTYIHSDGRREVKKVPLYCHNAPPNGLCAHVEHRNDSARVVEMRPSSSRGSPSEGEIITTGRDGRPRRYHTVSRRNSTKNSSGRTSRTGERSPADSMSPPAPLHPLYREVKPRAPTPPTVAGGYPSARRSNTLSTTFPPDPSVRITSGGTAVYDRPPSLEMLRAEINERPYTRPSSDIDEPPSPPQRPGSFRQHRPSNVVIDVEAASANIPASGVRSSPGLSNPPNPFEETVPLDKGKSRARVDSTADDARHRQRQRQEQQEDERQARLENEKLAEAERRQRARNKRAEEAAEEARERAAKIEREREDSSRERKERERRRTAAALEGDQRARQEAEIERKVNAEVVQVARERAEAEARREQQYQPVRPSAPAMSPRTSYHAYQYVTAPSPPSARTMSPPTATTTITARGPLPPYSVTVHNPSARRNSISERGEAVIAREQARVAAERMNEAMAGMQLEQDLEDDDLDAVIDAGMRRTASRRTRKEGKDREREQRKERERRLRDEGYF